MITMTQKMTGRWVSSGSIYSRTRGTVTRIGRPIIGQEGIRQYWDSTGVGSTENERKGGALAGARQYTSIKTSFQCCKHRHDRPVARHEFATPMHRTTCLHAPQTVYTTSRTKA